ncbi:hypothetical protein CEXT_266071 [Caerostris extrusa]|uniref:Uncharacterized protein n=1 Tax=Caerostris extrusa TaxID=172846 RepID=A0AAV4TYM8_CAEEX|nr:hypothetical protein CEXT_266071 [Caerostris extrusa]
MTIEAWQSKLLVPQSMENITPSKDSNFSPSARMLPSAHDSGLKETRNKMIRSHCAGIGCNISSVQRLFQLEEQEPGFTWSAPCISI